MELDYGVQMQHACRMSIYPYVYFLCTGLVASGLALACISFEKDQISFRISL